ncbi:MAG: hypothetical protein IPM98_22340 [Lewinellaceae bacterium]|nr:hypothetical protein [Lewinellaceae bacterium]
MIKKDIVEAEINYQKALKLTEDGTQPWIEVHILDALTELEWDRGNRKLAKSYLERAHNRAIQQKIDDLLVGTFEWKAYIAEQEGRFEEALAYTKKQYFHKEAFEERSAGFNLKNYYLQQEKDQLEADKREQNLKLSLKNTQLRYTLVIFILILLLAIGLFFGYQKQRQDKRALAVQNTLIQQQAEQLKSLDTAKSRFFANVSHELRTPLTLLLGPIHTLLKDGQLTDKQVRLLQMAGQSGKQLEQLVNDILDLRKLEQGHLVLHPKPTGLSAFVRTYCAQFESLAERKQIDFSVELPPQNTPAVLLDQEKFRQILFNLLANAFKFTPNGGRIETAVSVEAGMLHLRVADTGPGIHPDDLPHLFDRYFQTTRPDKPAEGGTGIGLALCHDYAQLFGGTIEVESILGKGSVLRVAFPVARSETEALAEPDHANHYVLPTAGAGHTTPVPSEISTGAKPTILVVEDNLDLQDSIRTILQEKYHVVTADHGQAALDVLGGNRENRKLIRCSTLRARLLPGPPKPERETRQTPRYPLRLPSH